MKWRYNPFDNATSRKIHSSNPFRPNFSQKGRIVFGSHLKRDWRAKKLFHQDNAPSHKSTVAMTKLRIGLWIDSSSILFSGFGPCDFFLFSNLKTWLGGKKFLSNEEVIVAVNEYFADFETAYFKWLPNVNYASFLAEIWPEGIRRVDFSRCRVIKWIVAPFHGNLPNLSNDPRNITVI